MRQFATLSTLFAALAPAIAVGCADPPLRVDHVVLISIDSLRADHVGAYGYPRPTTPVIDRLAAGGSVFTRAYSTTSWTLPSHAALFTGLDDYAHRVETPRQQLSAGVETLAEALGNAGIRTTGFYSGPYLHSAFGLGQGFDEYLNCTSFTPPETTTKGARATLATALRDVTNPILLDRIEGWLESASPDERHFIFVHMWDVHFDYIAPRSYLEIFDPDYRGDISMHGFIGNDAISREMSSRDLEHVIAQYDAEIRYTDETLGAILERLDAAGLMERTAVIVLADHGDEFFEHGQKGHKKTLYREVLHIPLVVHLTGQVTARARISRVVSIVDVYPTICELLGVACDAPLSGSSLVPLLRGDAAAGWRDDALAELYASPLGAQAALVNQSGKAIRWLDRGAIQYFEPTDLARERRPLRIDVADPRRTGEAVPPTLLALDARIAQARAAARPAAGAVPELDEQTRSQLHSLGYAE